MESKKSPTTERATDSTKASRRKFLATGAAAAALGAVQTTAGQSPAPETKPLKDLIAYGERSQYVKSVRVPVDERPSPDEFGLTFHVLTPLQDSVGMITPSSLHFIGTHRGSIVPDIDPKQVVPGFEGIYNTKWLRRIKVVDRYYMTYNDYGHIAKDEEVAALTFQWGPKSVITFPSGGQTLPGPGVYQLTGLAWSGGGVVRRVEVSMDGGQTWKEAEIRGMALPKAHTRFGMDWKWDGRECVLQSRCTDELGQVQPSRAELAAFFKVSPDYYQTHGVQGTDNTIQPWRVASDGSVRNAI